MKMTQNDKVLSYLQDYGSITQLQAITDLGCMRLAARVSELRKMGHEISSIPKPVANRFGETVYISEYKLEG